MIQSKPKSPSEVSLPPAGYAELYIGQKGEVAIKKDDGSSSSFLGDNTYDVRFSGVKLGEGLSAEDAIQNSIKLNEAFDAAAALGIPAFLPEGVIEYDSSVGLGQTLRTNASIQGIGETSVLKCVTPEGLRSSLRINSDNISLRNFKIVSTFLEDNRTEAECGIKVEKTGGETTLNIHISDLWLNDLSGAGIILRHVAKSSVKRIFIDRTGADGVHVTGNSYEVDISDINVKRAGDDGVAVVGYIAPANPLSAGCPTNVKISNVFCADTWHGRGVTVVGGDKIQISDVQVRNCSAAGIYISSESSYNTFASTNILIDNVLIDGTGNGTYGGIHIGGRSGNLSRNISITNSKILNSVGRGLAIVTGCANIVAENIQISGAGSEGVILGNSKDTFLRRLHIDSTAGVGIGVEATATGQLELNGIYGRNVNTAGTNGNTNLISINSATVLDRLTADNIHLLEQSTGTNRQTVSFPASGYFKYKLGENFSTVANAVTNTAPDLDIFATGVPSNLLDITSETSPLTWPNENPFPVWVFVKGGVLTSLELGLKSTISSDISWQAISNVNRYVLVRPGYSLRVTWSTKPTSIRVKPISVI